ncbi:hypothetical protein [Aurantivibrio infirmus]
MATVDDNDIFSKKTALRITATPSKSPDPHTSQEQQYNEQQQQLAIREKDQDLKFKKSAHKARIKYAKKVYVVVIFWLIAIALLVLANGITFLDPYFSLSDKVVITILTSTTVTVVGLFATVLKFLFGSNGN